MRTEIANLRALVSGPTKGIGQSSAANGAEVTINGRKKPKLESVVGKIGGTLPSERLVGEVNIRVNNVSP